MKVWRKCILRFTSCDLWSWWMTSFASQNSVMVDSGTAARSTTEDSGGYLQRHKQSKDLCKVSVHPPAPTCGCDERIQCFHFQLQFGTFLKSLTERRNTAGWFRDMCLGVLLSLLEKVRKEREILFLLPFQKASRILRPKYLGLPLPLSHRIRELCLEESNSSRRGEGGHSGLGMGVVKGMEKGHSTHRRRQGWHLWSEKPILYVCIVSQEVIQWGSM